MHIMYVIYGIMFVCVYICICICMYKYVCMYVYTYINIYILACGACINAFDFKCFLF
jgi:hypothetical protein